MNILRLLVLASAKKVHNLVIAQVQSVQSNFTLLYMPALEKAQVTAYVNKLLNLKQTGHSI